MMLGILCLAQGVLLSLPWLTLGPPPHLAPAHPCPPPLPLQVTRTHFHDFMLGVHSSLRKFKGSQDPLKQVADELALKHKVGGKGEEAAVLCLVLLLLKMKACRRVRSACRTSGAAMMVQLALLHCMRCNMLEV